MASDVAIDQTPNTGSGTSTQRITSLQDPTSLNFNQVQQNILKDFFSFGYYPTQAEVSSFIQSDTQLGAREPEGLQDSLTDSFIAQYVMNVQADQVRQANDPLAAFQQQANDIANQQQLQSTNLYTQAQQVFSSAPQLFGNLTPAQITEYLAPLQTAFTQAQSQTQAQLSARGLTGSNIEANALQTGTTNFENQVLQTGVAVGQTTQNNTGSLLAQEAGGLQTASTQNRGLQGQASGQLSSQNLQQQNYLNSLPYLYGGASQSAQATALAVQQAESASAGGGGIGSTIGTIGGGIIGGVYGGPAGAAAGASVGGSIGGGIGNAISPGTTGVQPGYVSGLPAGLASIAQLNALQPKPTVPNYTGGLVATPQQNAQYTTAANNGTLLPTPLSVNGGQ